MAMASFVSETVAAHLNNLSALFTKAMARVSSVVARLPGANLETGSWPTWVCLVCYLALLLLLVLAWRRQVRREYGAIIDI